MKWKPIDTAPKDGTPVLVYDENEDDITTMYYFTSGKSSWWMLCVEGSYCDESTEFIPTHWMELPEAPKESE